VTDEGKQGTMSSSFDPPHYRRLPRSTEVVAKASGFELA